MNTTASVLMFGAGDLDPSTLFYALITFVLGGGVASAYVAFRKAGPESEAVTVGSMELVIKALRSELARRDEFHEEQLRSRDKTIEELRRRIAALEQNKADKSSP